MGSLLATHVGTPFESLKIGAKETQRSSESSNSMSITNFTAILNLCCFARSKRQQWTFGFKSGEFVFVHVMELHGIEEEVERELNMSRTPNLV